MNPQMEKGGKMGGRLSDFLEGGCEFFWGGGWVADVARCEVQGLYLYTWALRNEFNGRGGGFG